MFLLAAITVVFAVGECLHGTIHLPLAADLASPRAGYMTGQALVIDGGQVTP